MPRLVAPAVAALLASAAAVADDGVRVAYTVPPPELNAAVLQALPPPPSVVVRRTKRYGDVTIDHERHVALRASCRACHLTLPISKIEYTPQLAHRACIGCHKERSDGPTQCAGCHVKPLPPAAPLTAEAPAEPAPAAATPPPAAGPPAGAVVTGQAPPARRTVTSTTRDSIELGFVTGPAIGVSLRASSRGERLVTMYSFERVANGDARLLGLLGLGYSHRLRDHWSLVALAMGGVDAVERPAVAVAPALALRAGAEYGPPKGRVGPIHLGLTCAVDVFTPSGFGADLPRTTWYATLTTGFDVRGLTRR